MRILSRPLSPQPKTSLRHSTVMGFNMLFKNFLHNYSHLALTLLLILGFNPLATTAYAQDRCPASDAHELSAAKYKLFTAYQTAYDGYQVSCELKCFEKQNCTENCQAQKGLQSLKKQMAKELNLRGLSQCHSLSQVCFEQCEKQGKQCKDVCDV